MKTPRVMIAAGASGSGKTLITCGILQALIDLGHAPCAFKCGPDYIDPMFHRKVIGTKSGNLDSFFCEDEILKYILESSSRTGDISILEGVMGYYDGVGGICEKASAYDVARITDTPVLLIAGCRGMSGSVAAVINGFKNFRKDSHIRGVILNQINPMLYESMKNLIEKECGIKVFGYMPTVTDCLLESRHLGLVTPDEIENIKGKLSKLSETVRNTIDLEGLIELANTAPDIDVQEPLLGDFSYKSDKKVKIAVARDRAFSFIYEDNLKLLERMGAEIIPFSPISDSRIPEEADGIIFYGGYPELYADSLESNISMIESIRRALRSDMPMMAECGGFMYLHEEFDDNKGMSHKGVGLIKGRAFKTSNLVRFGYIYLNENDGCTYGQIPSHEFHYFDSDSNGEAFTASKPLGKKSWKCIYREGNIMAGFPHMYYYGNPKVAADFVRRCGEYTKTK